MSKNQEICKTLGILVLNERTISRQTFRVTLTTRDAAVVTKDRASFYLTITQIDRVFSERLVNEVQASSPL